MAWATGRHALITGGGTGIGAAAARALSDAGAKISLLGRRREPLEAVAAATGGTAIACDVTNRGDMERAFVDARAAHGPFDFVILNAGVADTAPFLKTPRETWERIIATNLTALFDGAQLALPDLLEGDGEGKRLIFLASIAGLRGIARGGPYVASKHGAIGLMKCLALEYAQTRLTVNAVCPGFVDTPMVDQSAERIVAATGRSAEQAKGALAAMNPNGRLIQPEEIAAAIAHLCHPLSGSTTGSCLAVDGGALA